LVQTGAFAVVRNPYFLSYYAMLVAFVIIRPSIVLLALTLSTIVAYHRMVLREEKHLHRIHGQAYADYAARVGRYLPRKDQSRS
jgi:protein-S-isoprenylcysteine O-methyltransferase Ste14